MFSNQIFYEPENFECAYPKVNETLPPSKLGYHSNNKYDGFPPIMMDGRTITASWQPEAVLNAHLLKEINVQTNWQYRQYMTKNAKDIMKYNCTQSATDAGYFKRYADLANESYSTPYLSPALGSNDQLKGNEPKGNEPKGYKTSDLKELYLTREQLESRMVAPEVNQEDILRMRSKK